MPNSRKSDPATSRAVNRRLILNLLRRLGPRSRAALATETGLSAPAVTDLIGDLLGEGWVVEGERSMGAVGRRPVPVSLNYARGVAIGVRLKAGAIDCIATDLATNILSSITRTVDGSSPESFVDAILDALPLLVRGAGRGGTPITGIGVSLPGIVDAERGICRHCFRLGWTDVPFGALLAARADLPVWLEDDTNAYAIAQHLFGAGSHHDNFVAVAIGTRISSAIVVDGRLYRGARSAAGKFGHITHDPAGPLCECGRRGCLMACYAEPALVAAWAHAKGRTDVDRGEMLAAVAASDEAALSILGEAGEAIGRHLAAFVNVIDPEIIVVGGESIAFGEALFGPMRASLERFALSATPPMMFDWDISSSPRGAAALAMQKLFYFEQTGTVRPVDDGGDASQVSPWPRAWTAAGQIEVGAGRTRARRPKRTPWAGSPQPVR